MRVHLIVIGLVEGAPALVTISSPVWFTRGTMSALDWLETVCGNFVDPEGNGGSAPNETMICALTEDSDQPGAKGLVTLRCLHWESLRSFK